ncbi:MAG: hypothetical protein EPO36_00260 [Chloroflexota bacterium]|nr:MAG: hypothetical protein EPO36_00260 [Chloroflexota bacterium]
MTDELELDLDALPAAARDRLGRFAAEFERLSANDYALFATRGEDEAAVDEAFRAALEALGGASRQAAARAAAATFVEWAVQGYARRLTLPDTLLLYQSLPDRPEDRIRLARAIQAAVMGIIAWDELEAGSIAVLVGPFLDMAERATGEVLDDDPE